MNPRRAIVVSLAVAAAVLGVLLAVATLRTDPSRPAFKAVDVTGVPWGKGFELTDHHGRGRSLADFRGKVVTLFFGFTNCPDVCPTTMGKLAEAMRKMGPEAKDVQVLFVTVDPKRDTPEVLSKYVPAFHPGFLGLYADEATTERTAKEFKIFFEAQAPHEHGSYTVAHSTQVYVFDRVGRLRLLIKPEMSAEAVARDLGALLREPAG